MADAVSLADGTRLRLRAIGPDDRDRLAALFARLSPQSRYQRFFSPKSELTPRELSYFTEIDHVHHVAIAAVDERDGSMIGVAQYAEGAGRAGVAEIAVVVTDELHSMGIGTALATRTVERARANGLTLLTATTLSDNRPARALLRRFGFRAHARQGSAIELHLGLDSNSDCSSDGAALPTPQRAPRQRGVRARHTQDVGSNDDHVHIRGASS